MFSFCFRYFDITGKLVLVDWHPDAQVYVNRITDFEMNGNTDAQVWNCKTNKLVKSWKRN